MATAARPTLNGLAFALAVTLACKKDNAPPCSPEAQTFKVRVLVQPANPLNPDEDGNPLSVVFRIYQLRGDSTLDLVDFETVWQNGGKEAFGDDFISEEERIIYPERSELLEIEPDPEATHWVAAAIFREPAGKDWFRVWEVPKFHGHSVCAAERQGQAWPDPCFYVLLDRYLVDGGHTPPAGFDVGQTNVQCPGPPAKVPPPEPEPKKPKKKRKKLEDTKVPEVPEQPETPSAPKKPGG